MKLIPLTIIMMCVGGDWLGSFIDDYVSELSRLNEELRPVVAVDTSKVFRTYPLDGHIRALMTVKEWVSVRVRVIEMIMRA